MVSGLAPESVQNEILRPIIEARDAGNKSRLPVEEAKIRVEELIDRAAKMDTSFEGEHLNHL